MPNAPASAASTIGFVYQAHHLLPEFDALENVVLPQMIAGRSRAEAAKEGERLLDRAGAWAAPDAPARAAFGRRAAARRHRPRPGQQAAHPSGRRAHRQSRSASTAGGVFDALIAITRAQGLAALIATHNFELASRMDRALLLHQGKLIEGTQAPR